MVRGKVIVCILLWICCFVTGSKSSRDSNSIPAVNTDMQGATVMAGNTGMQGAIGMASNTGMQGATTDMPGGSSMQLATEPDVCPTSPEISVTPNAKNGMGMTDKAYNVIALQNPYYWISMDYEDKFFKYGVDNSAVKEEGRIFPSAEDFQKCASEVTLFSNCNDKETTAEKRQCVKDEKKKDQEKNEEENRSSR